MSATGLTTSDIWAAYHRIMLTALRAAVGCMLFTPTCRHHQHPEPDAIIAVDGSINGVMKAIDGGVINNLSQLNALRTHWIVESEDWHAGKRRYGNQQRIINSWAVISGQRDGNQNVNSHARWHAGQGASQITNNAPTIAVITTDNFAVLVGSRSGAKTYPTLRWLLAIGNRCPDAQGSTAISTS